MRWRCGVIAALAVMLLVLAGRGQAQAAAQQARWRPCRSDRWQYQLSDTGVASIKITPNTTVYIIDLETAADGAAAKIRKAQRNARVVCYFSAGSWERFRAAGDRKRGIKPGDWAGVLGSKMEGWPGERWVDVRSSKLRTIMRKRLVYAKTVAGCDGVDPDNVNGFQNPTGFPLTKKDSASFALFLAQQAHALGLAVGLKNAQGLLPWVASAFDFYVNEECFTYDECSAYKRVPAGRPVVGVQYCDYAEGGKTDDPACFCPRANHAGWFFMMKRRNLGAPVVSCRDYCASHDCGSPTATGLCKANVKNNCAAVGI